MSISRRSALLMTAGVFGQPATAFAKAADAVRFVNSAPAASAYHAPVYVGVPTGFYARLGLAPEFLWTSGSSAALQVLLGGDADIANVGFIEFVAAKLKQPSLPLHVVLSEDEGGLYVLAVPATSAIAAPADLKGKTVGVRSLASGVVATLKATLRGAGLKPGDVDIVAIGGEAQALAALRSGQIDAIDFYLGSLAVMEAQGAAFRMFPAPVPTSCFVATQAFVTGKRDVAVRAMQAIVLDTIYAEDNPRAAAAAFYKAFSPPSGDREAALTRDTHVIERVMAVREHVGDPRPWGDLSAADWAHFVAFAGPELGMTPKTSDRATYFDGSLIADVNKLDVGWALDAARTDKSP